MTSAGAVFQPCSHEIQITLRICCVSLLLLKRYDQADSS
jgi:hypothetical protein